MVAFLGFHVINDSCVRVCLEGKCSLFSSSLLLIAWRSVYGTSIYLAYLLQTSCGFMLNSILPVYTFVIELTGLQRLARRKPQWSVQLMINGKGSSIFCIRPL